MANPLEAWKQHATASEQMDLMGVGSHQKKGWNFAENFPALVPGTGAGPAQWIGPTLATGYQLGQEGLRSILPEKWGGTDIGFADAMKKGWTEAKQNIQGMGGKGFDKDEYDEWMHAQGYAPDYDFSGIQGQTAFLGLPQLFGMITKGGISSQAIKKAFIRDQISKQIGKKTRPFITKKIREARGEKFGGTGKFKTIATGTKDYGPHTKPKVKAKPKPKPIPDRSRGNGGGGRRPDKPGGFTDPGKGSYGPHKADGGLINFYRYGGFLG